MVSVAAALWLVGVVTFGQPREDPTAALARARTLIQEDLKYASAIEILERLASDASLRVSERVQAYRLLGVAYVATNAPESAEAAFAALLGLAPDHALDPRLSPKIHAVFQRAKARVVAPVRLVQVTAVPTAEALTVSAIVDDPQYRLQQVFLYARIGVAEFESRPMTRYEGRVRALIRLPAGPAEMRVDYFLRGVDRAGTMVTEVGSRDAPSSVLVRRALPALAPEVPGVAADPWYDKWWIWTLAAVAIGAAVTTAVVATDNGEQIPRGTLDPIVIDR